MHPSSPQVVSFKEALALTDGMVRDLLLGNGFSIGACSAFNYKHLLERATVSDEVKSIFASARTSNFELVMRILLSEALAAGNPIQELEANRKIKALKEALVRSIHEVHPARRSTIPDDKWTNCVDFLEHFLGRSRPRGGRVFTTNYDLLLSWAVAPDRDRRPKSRLIAYEGFKGDAYENLRSATIIYIHGALHLFSQADRLHQLKYRDTGVALHDQVAERLARGEYPVVVTEGTSAQKIPKSPGFLRDALKAFNFTCRGGPKKALFSLGHGLGPEDYHIIKCIPEGTTGTVCLGAYGSSEITDFKVIAQGWIAARDKLGKPPLKVYIFDSTSVAWGN